MDCHTSPAKSDCAKNVVSELDHLNINSINMVDEKPFSTIDVNDDVFFASTMHASNLDLTNPNSVDKNKSQVLLDGSIKELNSVFQNDISPNHQTDVFLKDINLIDVCLNQSPNGDRTASPLCNPLRGQAENLIEQVQAENGDYMVSAAGSVDCVELNSLCMLAFQPQPILTADPNINVLHDITTNQSHFSESDSESNSSHSSNQSTNKANNNKQRKKKNNRKRTNSNSSLNSSLSCSSPVNGKAKSDIASFTPSKQLNGNAKFKETLKEKLQLTPVTDTTTSLSQPNSDKQSLNKNKPKCQIESTQPSKAKVQIQSDTSPKVDEASSIAKVVQCDAIEKSKNQNNDLALNETSLNSKPISTDDQSCETLDSSKHSSESSPQSVTDASMEELDSKSKFGNKAYGQNAAESCKICSKHVYHMEQIKAVKAVFHKTCFRCKECNKQLNVDSYSSHEGIIYCKPHFKQLFQPKAVFESEDSKSKRKYELIISENTPQELPSEIVRSSAKQENVFENINLDLSNIRNRFENGSERSDNNENKRSNEKLITRSESIHKIMQKYQSRVSGDKDISSSDEEDNENKLTHNKEEKVAFSGMSSLKSQWETGNIKLDSKSDNSVEEELAELRQKVKTSEPLKQAYERAVQEAKSVENLSIKCDNIVVDSSVRAVSIKEKFEKGKVESEIEEDSIGRMKKDLEEEISRIAESETCTKEARNKFKQIEANMGKEQEQGANGQIDDISISSNELQQRFKYFENLKDNQPNFSSNAADEIDSIPKADTTKKMLDKFKALEAGQSNGQVNGGSPKSPKRITPPREIVTKTVENDEQPILVERDPNIVRSSYKSEEEIQVEPEKAKNLKAKFENWQAEIECQNRKNNYEEDEYVPNIDTTKNLRAMFESIKEDFKPDEKPRPRINRFVQETKATPGEVCYVCSSRLYPMEKMEFSGIKIHKNCFRCNKCHAPLRLDNFTVRAEKLFCIPHFKQLFMEKGNYDEGFGLEQHKDKWSHKTNGKGGEIETVNGNGVKQPAANGNGHCDSGDEDEDHHFDYGHSTEGEESQFQESLSLEYEDRDLQNKSNQLELDEDGPLDGPIAVENH